MGEHDTKGKAYLKMNQPVVLEKDWKTQYPIVVVPSCCAYETYTNGKPDFWSEDTTYLLPQEDTARAVCAKTFGFIYEDTVANRLITKRFDIAQLLSLIEKREFVHECVAVELLSNVPMLESKKPDEAYARITTMADLLGFYVPSLTSVVDFVVRDYFKTKPTTTQIIFQFRHPWEQVYYTEGDKKLVKWRSRFAFAALEVEE